MVVSTYLIGFAQANLERETGIEPATFSLARRCSTTEPLPHRCETSKQKVQYLSLLLRWAVRDSNSHGLRQRILSPPCLPISATARNAPLRNRNNLTSG